MEQTYINREEAALYLTAQCGLKVSKNTLQKWVTTGGGPVYRKFGNRAVYRKQDLDTWAEAKLSAPRMSSSAPELSIA
ncbi:MAG: helix-turn-helix domain-containing protein [Candidatus Accumulibacter sp.]|nr:helix-turn-helix domain-containing protein [Accumulibacter sp.]